MLNNVIHRCRFFTIQILILFLLVHAKYGTSVIPIGAVLDTNSPMGSMAGLCMRMAVSDFYANHPNYTTRLHLHTRNTDTALHANLAAVELLKHEEVEGIIGPQPSTEETFLAELGQNVRVPIISFASSSSAVSYSDNPYFVRTTPDEDVQARALAAICKGFGWSEFALLYEDTDYGSQFVSLLNKASQEVDIALAYMVAIPTTADDEHILKQLNKLATKQTRVFLVHMNPSLGYRLFPLAKNAGVMSEGYAWIITNSLSIFMNSMDSATRDSMEGVVGIRPYLSPSKDLDSFRERWKMNVTLSSTAGSIMELNAYGLWAYDSMTALAIAVQNIDSSILNVRKTMNRTERTNLSISTFGPQLLKELSRTRFKGLSGEFELVDGKLKPSAFEIFNVIGSGEKTAGFWTPDRGIKRDLSGSGSTDELRSIVWPGDSLARPKGWAIPTTGNLRVGIPWKSGYKEFVDAVHDPAKKQVNASGFSIDIFLATLEFIPFSINYTFHVYNDTSNVNWSYDKMLEKIPEDFDMVVGDTTNWAPRAEHVDFSLPYSEPGVILVVKNKKPFDMWIFVKPLSWDLWLAIIVACTVMGIVILVLERHEAIRRTDSMRARGEKSGILVYFSPMAALVFPERNMVSNNWSSVVLVFWLIMAFILMQSYTANLSAILTVDQLKFAFSDSYYVGYQDGSFMKEFLTDKLHISASRLRSYVSAEGYHNAMSLGSKNGGIDAIFDEIPYMKILLNKYDSQYKMVGPTYRTGGFGFAFPKGSPLAAYFSKAILDVTQGPNMTTIEQKNLGPGYSSQDPLSSTISQGTSSLRFQEFAGLFLVVGSVTVFALFCSEIPIGRKLAHKARQFVHSCINFKASRPNPVEEDSGTVAGEASQDINHESQQNNVITSSPSPQQGEVEMHETSSAAQNSDATIHTNANEESNS